MDKDFRFTDHGSICVLAPISGGASEWIADHISDEATRFGGGVVIEPRCAGDILDGIQNDGLTVEC